MVCSARRCDRECIREKDTPSHSERVKREMGSYRVSLQDTTGSSAAQRSAVQLPQARCTNCQKTNDLAREAVGCKRVLLECTCSQWSGVVNSGHGACYPSRDARRERVRGERLGEPQPPIGFSNLTCYLAPRRILASEMTSSIWSHSYRFVIRSAHKSVPLCSGLSTRSVA
jgi:hypothetical protein